MTASTGRVIEVDEPPSLPAVLAKAAIPRRVGPLPRRSGDTLPDTAIRRQDAAIDREHVAAYDRLIGFRLADTVPATYPFLLTFPLGLQLMSEPDFPFPLIGMVHLANRIEQARPVPADAVVDLDVSLADLRPHRKGQQLDMVAELSIEGDVAWRQVSTMLRRGKPNDDVPETPADGAGGLASRVPVEDVPDTGTWQVDADTGRRYAKVSGDFNPIHLTSLTAKPLGFPKAIAHGMWTAARCLASVESDLPEAFTYDVEFRQPVFLPSRVRYGTSRREDGTDIVVRGKADRLHLAGRVQA